MSTDDGYEGTELEALAEADNYYRWILRYFRPWLHGTVVEVGAGLGTFAARMRDGTRPDRLILVEPSRRLYEPLSSRFAADPAVETLHGTFQDLDTTPLDAIVLVNVLEHIERDAELLASAYAALRPGGALLLFVPALQWLYGSLDEQFGHHRRYSRAALRRLLAEAGFDIPTLRYMNLPGIASWLVAGRLLKMTTIRPASMRVYDRWVVSWVSRAESLMTPPLGQNLLAVAVRPPAGPQPASA